MPAEYPECPLYNPNSCREMLNPKVCAIVREDNECLKKKGMGVEQLKKKTGFNDKKIANLVYKAKKQG